MTALVNSTRNPDTIVVVGGGLAGLAAATYLARGGASVSLLEKAPDLGGRAATDTTRGFALNRGAHALYTGGAASDVLRELGVTYTAGIPKHVRALDSSGVHPFPATAMDLVRTGVLGAADKRELMAVLLRVGMLRTSSLGALSIADWIDANSKRPRVRQLLRALARVSAYTSALDLVSADMVLGRLQQNMRHPIHYIEGGWRTLVQALRELASAAGVRVRTSASVSAIDVRDGVARAVRLHNGTELLADAVVLALAPEDALRLLDQPRLRRHVERSVPAHIACLDLALERLPEPRHPVVIDLLQPRFMTAQSQFARIAPKPGAVVHAFKQLDPRQPFTPERDRADLEAFLDVVQPGWRDLIIERRFLPHMLASGALPLAARGGMAGRPGTRSEDVPNVYFAGDWVGADGFLVDTALGSARAAADSILSVSRYARAA